MGLLTIKSKFIGIPDIEIPVDGDLAKVVQASGGDMMMHMLLIQVLRELKLVKEGLRKLEVETAALASTPENLRLD